jgi:hypothetical protein
MYEGDKMNTLRFLEVTTSSYCPMMCFPYCPRTTLQKAYNGPQTLSLETFGLALSHTPKDVNICFSGFSEPFVNPHALEMMEMSHAQGHKLWLFTTLVGLKPEDVPRIKALDPYLCLHLPDPGSHAHIPTSSPNYQKTLLEALTTLRIDDYSRMDSTFKDNGRAGNLESGIGKHVRGPFYCVRLLDFHPVMLPSGDVVLCCMDFGMRHRLGSLLESTYDELERSTAFREIANGRWRLDGDTLCRRCGAAIPYYVHVLHGVRLLMWKATGLA